MLELTLENLKKVVWMEWNYISHELFMYAGPSPFKEGNSINLGPLSLGNPLINAFPCKDMNGYLTIIGFMNLVTGNKFGILKQINKHDDGRKKGEQVETPVKILIARQDWLHSDEYLDYLHDRECANT